MSRSYFVGEIQFSPEIAKTVERSKEKNKLYNKQASTSSLPGLESTLDLIELSSDSEVATTMANQERALRELVASD